MSLNYVELTLDLYDGQGNPVTSGTATLTPTQVLTDTTDHQITGLTPVTATFRPGTAPPVVKLLATDNTTPLPAGWAWTITPPPACGVAAFSFFLPYASGASQYLSAQIPVGSPSGLSQYLQSASNLADLASVTAARTNLGLGTAATQASTAFDAAGAATAALGSAETYAAAQAAAAQAASLQKSGNLTDVANPVTALASLTGGRQQVFYLDSYTGTDDQKMTSALAAWAAAGGGIIQLSPRAHTFANQWATAYSSGTVTNLRIRGAGAIAPDTGVTPAGATTCAMSYSGGGAARMDFQHQGSIEISGVLFADSGGSGVPFLQITNAVPSIHDNAFYGSATGTSCFQDAIVLGGTSSSGGAGDNAIYQGYQGVIRRNSFAGIRRIAYLRNAANSVEVCQNTVTATCGSNLVSGACIEINGYTEGGAGNHVWGNCIEETYYQVGVKVTAGTANILGPNMFFDGTTATLAHYWLDITSLSNVVYGGYDPSNAVLCIDQSLRSTVIGEAGLALSSGISNRQVRPVAFYKSPAVIAGGTSDYYYSSLGDYGTAYVSANGYALAPTLILQTATNVTVSDAATTSGSNIVTSATAAFGPGLTGAATSVANIGNGLLIAQVYAHSTPGLGWQASAVYATGAIALPTTTNGHLYQASTGGTSGSSQPAWPTGGGTVSDGSVVWQDLGTTATAIAVVTAAGAAANAAATATGQQVVTGNTGGNNQLGILNCHLVGQGSAPTPSIGGGSGSGATASCAGTDLACQLTINTGTGTSAGSLVNMSYALHTGLGAARVSVTPKNAAAAAAQVYANTNASVCDLYSTVTPAASSTLIFDIITIN